MPSLKYKDPATGQWIPLTGFTAPVPANSVVRDELVYNVKDHGATGDGTTNDAAAINSAATAAASFGLRLYANGTFRINSTINLTSNCDLTQATFNYYGTGTALKVGGQSTSTFVSYKTFGLPQVVAMNKVGNGWAGVVGSVGILCQNMYSCRVAVPFVRNFETGLKVYGESQGISYNTFDIQHLSNNKTNLLLDHNGPGWSNQNLYLNGRYSHDSNEGTVVAGVKHIRLQRPAGAVSGAPNNNTWLNTSLESPNTVQYCIDIDEGLYNRFINCRFEVGGSVGSVRWGPGAGRNQIEGGYGLDDVVETWVTGATFNTIDGPRSLRRSLTYNGMTLENGTSSANPIITLLRAGGIQFGDNPATAYTAKLTAQMWALKRYDEANDRLRIDMLNSRIYFGNGTAAPTCYLSAFGTGGIALNAGHLYFGSDNAFDIGVTAQRPRYGRFGTAVQTGAFATASRPAAATAGQGAMVFDTTLGKPVWSTGTAWVEAAGGATASSDILNVKDYGAVGDGVADDTAAINTAATAAGSSSKRLRATGSFKISGTIAIPAGVTFDATEATFTQITSNTISMTLATGAALLSGTLVGKATDYVAGIASPTAIGIQVNGTDVVVNDVTLVNHAGAGIRIGTSSGSGFSSRGCRISAPALTIPNLDPACFGIYMDGVLTDISISDIEIWSVSIGIIGSKDLTHLSLRNVKIHDVTGQHGLYIENGTGLVVDGLDVWNVAYMGMKLQMGSTNSGHEYGTLITNINAHDVGDTALSISNTDPALTFKHYNVTVANVVATNCLRALYLGSVRGATVNNVSGNNITRDGVSFLDCWDVAASNIAIDGAGYNGVLFNLLTNGSNRRITLADSRIRNAGGGNVAGSRFGISIADGADLTIDGIVVGADNGLMQYGLYFSAGDQSTFTLRNSEFSGDTGSSVRLIAGPLPMREWSNVRCAGDILAFPTTLIRGGVGHWSATVIPTSGVWRAGDRVYAFAPVASGSEGWVCITAGGASSAAWGSGVAYTVGQFIRNASNRVYECVVAGTSGATEPTSTVIGATTVDGGVTWITRSTNAVTFKTFGVIGP